MKFIAEACSHLITWLKIWSLGSYPIYALINLLLYVVVPVLSWIGFVVLLRTPRSGRLYYTVRKALWILIGGYMLFHIGGLLFVVYRFLV